MPPRESQTFDLPPSLGPTGDERIGRAVGIALTRDEGILKKGHFVADAEFINTKLLSQRELLSVKGIGEKKAAKIMMKYKTKANLLQATPQELAVTAGVNEEVAMELWRVLHN